MVTLVHQSTSTRVLVLHVASKMENPSLGCVGKRGHLRKAKSLWLAKCMGNDSGHLMWVWEVSGFNPSDADNTGKNTTQSGIQL